MMSDATPVGDLSFKDRKAGLVLFGIVEILIGLALALLVCGMVLGRSGCRTCSAPPAANQKCTAPPVDAKTMIPAAMVLGLGAACFVILGMGSIRCRRWARSLMLIFAWFWMVTGLVGMFFVAAISLRNMQSQMPQGGSSPMPAFFIFIAVMFLVYVSLPALFVWFYGSKNVKATVEYRDPQIRWTDRCPLPVLAVSLLAGWSALSWLVFPIFAILGIGTPTAFPLFGRILTGAVAGGVQGCFVVLMVYVAWGAYKLNIRAWWCAVILAIVCGVSAVVNTLCLDPMELYKRMNLSAVQLDAIRKIGIVGNRWTYLTGGLWCLAGLAYLLWIRRFFSHRDGGDRDVSPPQI
ncbi:MAG: hypothetical protein ABFC77_09915 [Thermoguttaceae bacterium]